MDNKNTSQTLSVKNGKSLEFVNAKNSENLDIYVFLIIDELEKKAFYNGLNNSNLDLEKYGRVVESGYGFSPLELRMAEIKALFEDNDLDE